MAASGFTGDYKLWQEELVNAKFRSVMLIPQQKRNSKWLHWSTIWSQSSTMFDFSYASADPLGKYNTTHSCFPTHLQPCVELSLQIVSIDPASPGFVFPWTGNWCLSVQGTNAAVGISTWVKLLFANCWESWIQCLPTLHRDCCRWRMP